MIHEGNLVHVQYKNLDFTGVVLSVFDNEVEVKSVGRGEIYFVPLSAVTKL